MNADDAFQEEEEEEEEDDDEDDDDDALVRLQWIEAAAAR
jgi:hypothetical protein